METFLYSFHAVAPVFLVVIAGYFLGRIKLLDAHFADMASKFCFSVGFPCLIFQSVYESDYSSVLNWRMILLAALGVVGGFTLMMLVTWPMKVPNTQKSVIAQAGFRSNSLMLGIPILRNMFGEIGVGLMSVTTAFIMPLFNLLVVAVFILYGTRRDEKPGKRLVATLWGVVKNPLVIASVLGILLSVLNVPLPKVFTSAVGSIASIATPLSLICMGVTFDFARMMRNIKITGVACLFRLIVVPVLFGLVAVRMGFRGVELSVLYVLFANPVSSTSYAMANHMGGDGDLAGEVVLMTMFCSMFTLFLGVFTLRQLGLI